MKLRTQTTFPSTNIGTNNTATALVPHEDKGSLAPVGAESRALSAPDLAPHRAARAGRSAATFAAGLLIGVIGAVPATGWVVLRAGAAPPLASFTSLAAPAKAAAAAPKDPAAPPPSAPAPADLAPRAYELACVRDWEPPCRETAITAQPVALGAKTPARAKGRRMKKPHGDALAAGTSSATSAQGPAAQGAASAPVVEAARALIDHQADTELSDALK